MGLARSAASAVFLSVAAAGVLVVSLGIGLAKREAKDLPDAGAILDYRPAATTRFFAADGTLIGRFGEQDRTLVRFSDIPPLVVQAFVSAEDRNFWTHKGVDPVAVVRALLTDVRNRGSGRRMVGASTITQQLVKNLVVGDEASFHRKVREALLAIRIDRDVGKERVLELYLNELYLGQGAYGVESASRAYFGKHVGDLDLAEAAFLAALPKGPANYDPVRRPEAAAARRSYVLGRMTDDGAVSRDAADAARAEPLPRPVSSDIGGAGDGYFIEDARREALARYGSNALYRGGLSIRTSMDPALQAIAEKSLRDGLVDYDRRHGFRGPVATLPGVRLQDVRTWEPRLAALEPPSGAEDWRMAVVLSSSRDAVAGMVGGGTATLPFESLRWARVEGARGPSGSPRAASDILHPGDVVLARNTGTPSAPSWDMVQMPEVEGSLVAMEAATGRVLAVAGGFSHERGAFDRATQSLRQPGSSFKPFVYLAALETGYDPTSPLLDTPIAIDPGGGAPRWRPGADGGNGKGLITLRQGLEQSRNYASVRLVYDLGLDVVADVARAFGVYDKLPNFSAALGTLEVTDLQMTAAYSAIANGGHRVRPSFIDSSSRSDGTILDARSDASGKSVADPFALAQLTSMLQGVVRRGTAAPALARLDLPIAGKTGTTNDVRDAWFVGFSPDIAVGVHVGYDRSDGLGADETGGRAAAPIFGAFMKSALEIRPPSSKTFRLPPGSRLDKLDPVTGLPSKNGVEEVVRGEEPTSAEPRKTR